MPSGLLSGHCQADMAESQQEAGQRALVTLSGSGACAPLWEAGSSECGSCAKMRSRGEVSEMAQVSSRRGSASPIRFNVV